jgi:AraC-like DNA-binding protein
MLKNNSRPQHISQRQSELADRFQQLIDGHLEDIVSGKVTEMYHVKDIAEIMCVQVTHLSDTIKLVTGESSCNIFEGKILGHAKRLMTDTRLSIREIAFLLTYDSSNFNKFFKRFTGLTPNQYRKTQLQAAALNELNTISHF